MYFHILARRGKRTKKYCSYNLDKEKLSELFLEPYRNGLTIVVSGESFNKKDNPIIRIVKTQNKVDTIIDKLNANSSKNDIKLQFYRPDIFKLSQAKDVTHELLGYIPVSSREKNVSNNKNIFIVHGHDNCMRRNVCDFLKKNGYNPIVLQNEANLGATIIEKIEAWASEVCYGIVLYSPDDVGKDKNKENLKFRGRQNVVFEHGYLMAKLGRDRVCYLIKEDIETPGDIDGLVYTTYSKSCMWRAKILQELKKVGA